MNIRECLKRALLACLLMTASACGGGGADSGSGDPSHGEVRIIFPGNYAYMETGTADSLSVRGSYDGVAAARITVNDVEAHSTDGFATWTAEVPVPKALGDMMIEVDVTDSDGASLASTTGLLEIGPIVLSGLKSFAMAGNGDLYALGFKTNLVLAMPFGEPSFHVLKDGYGYSFALAWHAARDALVVAPASGAIREFDPKTNEVKTLSDSSGPDVIGTGPVIYRPDDIAIDADGNYAYLAQRQTGDVERPYDSNILRVDLATGNRTSIADSDDGGAVALNDPYDLALDHNAQRLFVAQRDSVLVINLADRARTELPVGDLVSGTGTALAYDVNTGRLILYSGEADGIYSIDPGTGDTDLVAGPDRGDGPLLQSVSELAIDPKTGEILLSVSAPGAIIRVDLETGNRTAEGASRIGEGEQWSSVVDIVANGNDLLVADEDGARILRVPRNGGAVTEFSGAGKGDGPAVENVSRFKKAQDGNGIYLLSGDEYIANGEWSLMEIDRENGDRKIVSSLDDTGLEIGRPIAFALHEASRQVYIASADLGANLLHVINLDTQAHETLAMESEDSLFPDVTDIVLDHAGNRLVLASINGDTDLVSLDLSTGQMAPMTFGDYSTNPERITLTSDRQLLAQGFQAMLALDLATGETAPLTPDYSDTGSGAAAGDLLDANVFHHDASDELIYLATWYGSLLIYDIPSGDRVYRYY